MAAGFCWEDEGIRAPKSPMEQGVYVLYPQKNTKYIHSPIWKKEPYIHSQREQ